MSSRAVSRSSSWFRRLAGMLPERPTRTARKHPNRRVLTFEPLDSRAMLSATVLPSISGVVFNDVKQDGLVADGAPLAYVTVNLFRDGGDGQYGGKASGSDDTLASTTTTDASGKYQFANLSTGTYFVQQLSVPGLVLPSNQGVAKVTITDSDTTGVAGTVIDTFANTAQYVTGGTFRGTSSGVAQPMVGANTGSSVAAAPEAIGGYRDLYVQLSTTSGALSLGADANVPNALEFSSGAGANGLYWVTWDGSNNSAQVINPTGLGQLDLTSQGASTGIKLTLGADHNNGFVMLKVYTDASNWSFATVAIPNTGDGTANQDAFVPWTSFTTGGGSGANFTKVGAIQLDINGVNAIDGEIGPISAAGPKVFATNFANTAQIDLAITKSDSPDPVVAGNQLTYTVVATNNGPSAATGVAVTDPLPASVTYVSGSSTQGSVTCTSGNLTATIGNLASGASATITFTATVAPGTTGTITNTATVRGNEPESNTANNTATAVTTVNSQVDLAITKSGTPNPVKAGNQLTYTLTTTNNGPSNATGVTIVDTLPANVTYVSTTGSGTATYANGKLTINVGNMAVGGSATDTIVVTVNSGATGTLTNTAVVSGNETETNMANNTATCTTQIDVPVVPQAQPDVAILKSATPSRTAVGSVVHYTLLIDNSASAVATGVTVTDSLPSGVSLVSGSVQTSQGTVVSGSGVQVQLGTMQKNSSATVSFDVLVLSTAGSSITNTATVYENETDANPDDNTSSVTTPLDPGVVPSKRLLIG
jgi:large repetitive protein